MKGDFSRNSFRQEKHYRKVNMQQGRVNLDSDYNEQNEIFLYLQRKIVKDIVGQHAAPVDNAGFKIIPNKNEFTIGAGHYYIDGILCENESTVLATQQPYMPMKSRNNIPARPSDSETHLVYLDVWERDISCVDDDNILEPDLGGVDTATRTKLVWQVKVQPINSKKTEKKDCSAFEVPEKCSSGKMKALSYSGLENFLYRIEIHDAGRAEGKKRPTFKWSRKNGSIVTKITKVSEQSITMEQNQVNVRGDLATGDWIEITDDLHELNQLPGTFVKINEYNDSIIKFNANDVKGEPITENNYQNKHNPKIRKWGSSPIEIILPLNEEDFIYLENGIKIQFSKGSYQTGDYWLMPCRPNIGILWEDTGGKPSSKSADGVKHHYCPLAIIKKKGKRTQLLSDCRRFFHSLSDQYARARVAV